VSTATFIGYLRLVNTDSQMIHYIKYNAHSPNCHHSTSQWTNSQTNCFTIHPLQRAALNLAQHIISYSTRARKTQTQPMSPLSTNHKMASQYTRFRQARKQSSYTEANRIRNKVWENAKPLLWAYLWTCPYAARSSSSEIAPPAPSSSLNLQAMVGWHGEATLC
jgi:hypothetical protein